MLYIVTIIINKLVYKVPLTSEESSDGYMEVQIWGYWGYEEKALQNKWTHIVLDHTPDKPHAETFI